MSQEANGAVADPAAETLEFFRGHFFLTYIYLLRDERQFFAHSSTPGVEIIFLNLTNKSSCLCKKIKQQQQQNIVDSNVHIVNYAIFFS